MNTVGGGIMLFISEDIPCKEIKFLHMNNMEGIFIEINLRKMKWLLFAGYNLQKANASNFFEDVEKNFCAFLTI